MTTQTRKFIQSLLPEGSAWAPQKGGDYDKFLDAYAQNVDNPKQFLEQLAYIRDPLRTPLLDELEIEFGVTKNDNLTELQRRTYLNSLIFTNQGNGTAEDLQARLQEAGFPVQIHVNDPAVDPNIFVDQIFKMQAGGLNAYAGREDAFARRVGGELIVNGDQFKQVPIWSAVAGSNVSFSGNQSMYAGSSIGIETVKIEYEVPTNPADWPFIFFIGGDATRDGSGFLTEIERVVLSNNIRNEFLQILLKYKPLYTWGVSLVDFV